MTSSSSFSFWRGLLLACFLSFALLGCKGKTMMPPANTYFEGPQLALAELVDQADAEAVYQMAKAMPLEELNAFGIEHMTVLLYAGRKTGYGDKWLPVVTALIKAGADPLLEGLYGDDEASLMGWAMGDAYRHDLKLLKAALDAGINPDTDAYTKPGGPLISMHIAGQGGLDAIRLLVEHGADVNRRDIAGGTAISESIETLGLDEVNYLLDHGANPNVVDYYGTSFPYLLSEKINNLQTLKDPRFPKALAIRDRIVKMGAAWPPETPEQFRARVKTEQKKKTGKDFVFMPDPGYKDFIPKYVPAPVRKEPLKR
jgi:hypothetical protein